MNTKSIKTSLFGFNNTLPKTTFFDKNLKFTDLDLNEQGQLNLFTTCEKNVSLEKLRRIIVNNKATPKEKLPIIKGHTLEIEPDKLNNFINNLPKGAKTYLDIPFKISKPLTTKVSLAKNISKMDIAIDILGIKGLWEKGYKGKGVTTAVIDSGIYPHPDLEDNMLAFEDFSSKVDNNPQDDYGHGTHIAGIIAGTGKISQGRYSGIAPESKVVGLKVEPVPSQIIKAISWAVKNKDKYNIKIINLSFGSEARASYQDDILAKACEIAVKNGLIVVVAAGNDGPNNGTINSPGIDPLVITVGNLNDKNTITPLDDEIDFNSSRGPTPYDGLSKPDLIARGINIVSALAPNSILANEVNSYPHIDFDKDGHDDYLILSGSSMATAMVSGIIAILLQANPKLTPNQIKFILMSTAKSLKGHTIYDQGAGVIDPASSLTEALNLKSYYQIT